MQFTKVREGKDKEMIWSESWKIYIPEIIPVYYQFEKKLSSGKPALDLRRFKRIFEQWW